jgi:hypothetical protein
MPEGLRNLAQVRPGDAQTVLYTAPAGVRVLVRNIAIINLTGEQQIYQLYHVPAGISSITPPAADYAIARSHRVNGRKTVDWSCFIVMEPGDMIIGGCATGQNVNFHIDGLIGLD